MGIFFFLPPLRFGNFLYPFRGFETFWPLFWSFKTFLTPPPNFPAPSPLPTHHHQLLVQFLQLFTNFWYHSSESSHLSNYPCQILQLKNVPCLVIVTIIKLTQSDIGNRYTQNSYKHPNGLTVSADIFNLHFWSDDSSNKTENWILKKLDRVPLM